ncbi:MAG: nucleotide exchange factor GrpE [Actinomycetota bacterium]|nr:nucleotide exchange factor GrpE [Actinomycetota bacterium]
MIEGKKEEQKSQKGKKPVNSESACDEGSQVELRSDGLEKQRECPEQIEQVEQKESLEERIEELEMRNIELEESLLRLRAEFENYRKRIIKEQTRILETAEADLVRKLLPVIDNLERAVLNSEGNEGSESLLKGVRMVLDQTLEILKKEGLEVIDPQGMKFDPENHEAVMVVETEECPEDTVLEVAQKGYRFRGELLRPAMVKVSCSVKENK